MSKIIYKDASNYDEMSKITADIIIDEVNRNPEAILCLAGGDTPLGTYKFLVEANNENKVDFSKCTFVGLDEWVGLGKEDLGSCRKYLDDYLFKPLNINEENIMFIDAKTYNLEKECERFNNFLDTKGPLDVCLLGVGVNGHLGFNEPYAKIDNKCHITDLDETTKEVGKKYFNGEMRLTQGITLGLKQLLDSKVTIVVASGETKSEAISYLKKGEYLPEKPVTVLNKHNNCYAVLNINI